MILLNGCGRPGTRLQVVKNAILTPLSSELMCLRVLDLAGSLLFEPAPAFISIVMNKLLNGTVTALRPSPGGHFKLLAVLCLLVY